MKPRRPDWRWLAVQKAVETNMPPEDAFLRDIYNVIMQDLDHEIYKYVLELYGTPSYRDTMIAWFLSGATTDQIVQGSEVHPDALAVFEKLFIDASVFRNKLEWRAYADYYAANCCHSDAGKKQIKIAILEGPIPLLAYWKKGNEIIKVTDEEVLSSQLVLAHIKSLAARNASVTDPTAKEAFKWGQFAVNTAQRRNALDDNSEIEVDAIVAIQRRKATVEAQEIGLNLEEIQH